MSRSPRGRAPMHALSHLNSDPQHPFVWDTDFVRAVGQRARAPLVVAALNTARLHHLLEQNMLSKRTPELEDFAAAHTLSRLMVLIMPPESEADLRTKAEAVWMRPPGPPDLLLEQAIESVLIEDALRLHVTDASIFSNPNSFRLPF